MLDKNDRFDVQMFWVYRLLLGSGDVALDVGGNQGAHTAVMADAVGSTGAVFAFEPIPVLFHGLKERFKDKPWVRIFPQAISDTDGTTQFFVNTSNVSFCSGLKNQDEFSQGQSLGMDIDTRRIDSLDLLRTQNIRLIKLDVEGAELLALHGASETFRRTRPACVFEWGDAVSAAYGATAGDMWKFWATHEYSLCDVHGTPIESEDAFAKSSLQQDVWNYVAVPLETPPVLDKVLHVLRSVSAALDDASVDQSYESFARSALPIGDTVTFGSPHEELSIDVNFSNQSSFAWLDLADDFYAAIPSRKQFPSPVQIGLRWFTPEGAYVTEERRSLRGPGVLPGEELSTTVAVYPHAGYTLLPSGEYCVTIGLVHENVTWFKEKGDAEIALRVRLSGAGFPGVEVSEEPSS